MHKHKLFAQHGAGSEGGGGGGEWGGKKKKRLKVAAFPTVLMMIVVRVLMKYLIQTFYSKSLDS